MQGVVEGRDLFELAKHLARTRKSGLLNVQTPQQRAEIYINQGAIVGAFYGDLSGSQALTRALLVGKATYLLERHEGKFPRNVTQDTAFVLDSIERVLTECGDSLWGADGSSTLPRADDDGLEPSESSGDPDTLLIANFAPPETGKMIGKCRLETEIGRGASAIVYRARHTMLDADVVVKVLMQGSEDQEQHRNLTRNEAQILARLNHPHVLRVFDFDDRGRYPHVVMEFVDGTSLGGMIGEYGAIEPEVALPLFCQVAEGLAYAHTTLGLVHCDIKPTNILVTKGMLAKVADFGLAKVTRMTPVQQAARDAIKDGVAGTPAYIAPEQVQGGWDCATHRSDIYSLGATFYHVLTGRPPFEDADPIELMAMRLHHDPIPPHVANAALDRDLSDLVMLMLHRDPVHRLHTWDDVLNALYAQIEKREQEQSGDGKVIRRRTSFWSQAPARLFKKTENGAQVG
jgi:tRNA A-37 threonylcarbamoyl transferase component Bud32